MNATLFIDGKVHQVDEGRTRCGVGKRRTPVQWQMELGEVTCQRCVRLQRIDSRKEAQTAQADATLGDTNESSFTAEAQRRRAAGSSGRMPGIRGKGRR
jgi:hypothetical protein